jgi:N-acetylmuramoyl-L-alanine amidase
MGPPMARLLLFLALLMAGAAAARPVAGVIRVEAAGGDARVRIALSEAVPGPLSVLALTDPLRLAIDLPGVATERRAAAGAGPIAEARFAQFTPEIARLVVALDRPARVVAARLAPGPVLELVVAPAPFRAGRQALALEGPSPGALDAIEALLAEPAPTPSATPARQIERARAKPLVVLDPGHGGRDVGAIAVTGGYEKDVTLAVAKAAARRLERSGKVEVRLTRTDDRFLTLGERVRLARAWGADLFVSIHADSAPNLQARGASVYTLSETASDREAARLAAKENRADAIAGADLTGVDGDAQAVLIDLARRDSMNASADFAGLLQRRLAPEGVMLRSTAHRFAGFAVLRNLGVPAVLLECGYLSNEEDASVLFSERGRNALAAGIAKAAEAWLVEP